MHERNPCLTDEELAALADHSLSRRERRRLEIHLAECGACREGLRELLRSLEPDPDEDTVPSGLGARILEAHPALHPTDVPGAATPARAKERTIMRPRLAFLAATAAAVLVASSISLWVGMELASRRSPPPIEEARPRPRLFPVTAPPELPALGDGRRYLAHLFSDKPLYRPGETLRARAVILDAFTRVPAGDDVVTHFEVRAPSGAVVVQSDVPSQKGVSAYEWVVPADSAGGDYVLAAALPAQGCPEARLEFDLRAYRLPRLLTELEFLDRAYGPGEEVAAVLRATRAEGGVPAGASVTAVATAGGREVHRQVVELDADGACSVSFRLPDELEGADGTLALTIADGGVVETAARSIPIVLERLDLAFYPEGGELIARLESKVYFEARTARGEPADVSGKVIDGAGGEVARFESIHEGRGAFHFRPDTGAKYRVVLERPAGIAAPFELPAVQDEGFALAVPESSVAAGRPVEVAVSSPVATGATVVLAVRERELARELVALDAGEPRWVRLSPEEPAGGVLRVTVFDAGGIARAERLVFQRPERSLDVRLEIEPRAATPGAEVRVAVETHGEGGEPVAAVLGVGVVDASVLAMETARKRAPRLPAAALLGAEVRELRDAAAYLATGAEAERRLDLLLGTQGWRRFAFANVQEFLTREKSAGERVLAARADAIWGRQLGAAPVTWDAFANERVHHDLYAYFKIPVLDFEDATVQLFEARDGDVRFWAEDGITTFLASSPSLAPGPVWQRLFGTDPGETAGVRERSDFAETIYWNPRLETDASGRTSFTFRANDSLTTFRVRADGFTQSGALGQADAELQVHQPFSIEPKLPLEVTAGDRIDLPIALANRTGEPLDVELAWKLGDGLESLAGALPVVRASAGSSSRTYLPLRAGGHAGPVDLRLAAAAGAFRDALHRRLTVVPAGFPVAAHRGGILDGEAACEVEVPADVEAASLRAAVTIYPSPLASLSEALAALLREPTGCFEQASSANYPNTLTLLYLRSHAGADPALVRRASALVETGYRKLAAYECTERGYEWFGKGPGHEALTAYGILEFTDMARVHSVDEDMLARTRRWLLSRRDGEGGFLRHEKSLDSFGRAPKGVTDAYIVWALTEAGEKDLEREIASLLERSGTSEDPYFLALVANSLLNAGSERDAAPILERLASKQEASGALPGAATSITCSGGESLAIETLSLAVLAWLRLPEHAENVERAMRWVSARCQGGRFGSTQSTVLALKAIVAYNAARARPREGGKVLLTVDGRPAGEAEFEAGREEAIVLPAAAEMFPPGRHTVRLRMEGGSPMPFSVRVEYNARTPASSPGTRIALRTSLTRQRAAEGEPVDVTLALQNRTDEGLPMVVAAVGIPAGLEPRAEQLEELVRGKQVDFFEIRGRDVVLYWRGLEPRAERSLILSTVAAIPGETTGPASRAYLYYTDELKTWVPGLAVEVARR